MRRVEAVKRRVSFADLQRMPEDGNRYELYDGELRVVPSPLLRHQMVSARLFELLLEYRRVNGGQVFYAPLDIVLSEFDVLQPDLMYFGPQTATRLRPDEYIRSPPDLAIEVLSPSTAKIDRGRNAICWNVTDYASTGSSIRWSIAWRCRSWRREATACRARSRSRSSDRRPLPA